MNMTFSCIQRISDTGVNMTFSHIQRISTPADANIHPCSYRIVSIRTRPLLTLHVVLTLVQPGSSFPQLSATPFSTYWLWQAVPQCLETFRGHPRQCDMMFCTHR